MIELSCIEELNFKITEIYKRHKSSFEGLIQELKNFLQKYDLEDKIKLANYIVYFLSVLISKDLTSDFILFEVEEIKDVH